jgi:hypothetical protein
VPNLPAHIALAHQAAQSLGHPTLEANMGQFLLGSTSPDIRIITRRRREEYHFAPLDFEAIGAGIRGLFDAHPRLLPSSSQNGPTQAFIAGYITHIIADELWIVQMYRPYFGNRTVFQDEAVGNVMDRALQLELDRQSWQTVEARLPLVDAAADGVDVDFIPPGTLAEWRRWVAEFVGRGFSWERLRFMGRRIAAGDEGHPANRVVAEFLQGMPSSLERLYDVVPRDNLSDFKARAIEALTQAVGDYLP